MRIYFSFVYSHIINIMNIGFSDIVSCIRCYCLQCYCLQHCELVSTLSTRFHYSACTTIIPYIVTLLGYLNFIFSAYLLTKFNVRDNNALVMVFCCFTSKYMHIYRVLFVVLYNVLRTV